MKISILIIGFSLLFISACTQARYIQKSYAFFQEANYGTIAVDDKGNQLTAGSKTTSFIYLECKGNEKPEIDNVIYNGETYKNPSIILQKQNPLFVGIKNPDGEKIILTPAKENSLWKIELNIIANKNEKIGDATMNKIIINGKKNSLPFTLTINNEIELQPVIGS